jgi:hypothetical protein
VLTRKLVHGCDQGIDAGIALGTVHVLEQGVELRVVRPHLGHHLLMHLHHARHGWHGRRGGSSRTRGRVLRTGGGKRYIGTGARDQHACDEHNGER